MTVSTATSRIEYTGDAVTTAFSFPYYFLANGDLKVYLDGVLQTITTHYTVAGAGVPAGGTVTFVTAPPNGDVVVIYRQVAITQPVDYTPNDPFPANTHEQALDRLTMITQQLDEEAGRALALPSTSTYSDLTLPDPQANYYLQWKADLSGLQNVAQVSPGALSVTPYIETLLNDADAATARTTLEVPNAVETLTNKTLTSPVLNGSISGTGVSNDTTLAGDSATEIVTEHAVKAYVDNKKQLMSAVYNSSNQSIPNNTQTKLIFPNELYDPLGTHDNVTNNTRITIPTGYTGAIFKFSGSFSAAATGQRRFDLTKNNISDIHGGTISIIPASATYIQKQFFESPLLTVTTGDYFEVRAFQDSGGAIDVNGGVNAYGAIFSVELFV